MTFTKESIRIDPAAEADRIVSELRRVARQVMRRGGGVVGISGGVDSAVVLALTVRAFDPERVVALIMPEKDSEPMSEQLARELARQFGVQPVREDITPTLEGFGCYQRRDEAVRRVFPEYDAAAGYKVKIGLPPNMLEEGTLNVFSITIVAPDGHSLTKPLPPAEFRQIVAGSNFKQRARMAMLYYHAELRNYAVIGTANKNEHDQGFFVKHGDAGVDIRAIGHLYKTQVYQLAEHLNVPEAIRKRPPTSDTYSASCDQQEFFFRLPFETLDLLWYAQEHQVSAAEVARAMDLTEAQVQRAFDDFKQKRRATEFLRMAPVAVG
ncbi:MAG: NAD(+) synthase [Verrucomicrobiia bacterium]|jgi:NAD+ synthase